MRKNLTLLKTLLVSTAGCRCKKAWDRLLPNMATRGEESLSALFCTSFNVKMSNLIETASATAASTVFLWPFPKLVSRSQILLSSDAY